MSDLLKEAIADAKAVRETALQNAKMALQEAFTPQLKSMLSAKLREEEPFEDEEEEFGDPYIYLFDDTTDELIQQDDDGGCDCGTYEECGESGNCWDSAITRTLNPGTYRLEVDVYSQETTGYYNVTIQENQETEEP